MRQKIKFVGQLWSQQIFVICCSMRQKASSSSWFAYCKEKQQLGRQNIIIMMSSCHAMPRSFDDKVKIKKCSCHILGNLIWIHHLLLSRYYIFFDTLEKAPRFASHGKKTWKMVGNFLHATLRVAFLDLATRLEASRLSCLGDGGWGCCWKLRLEATHQ